jgi:desulfoferrodoxin (superoxide reductase-like protein)
VLFDLLDSLDAAAAYRLPGQTAPAPVVVTPALPRLARFMAGMRARPRIAAYLASARRLPHHMPRLPAHVSGADATWAAALASHELVHSAAHPGQWAEKVASHTPVATRDGARVTIRVPHEMAPQNSPQNSHFISAVFAVDAHNPAAVVALARFAATDAAAVLEFDHAGDVVPYAVCNKHGLWLGEKV